MSNLLHHMTSDGKPAHYSKSFDALADWVDSSLDMYRVTFFLLISSIQQKMQSKQLPPCT